MGGDLHAQTPGSGVDHLLARVHAAVAGGDAGLFASLFLESVADEDVARARHDLLPAYAVRRVARDRARLPVAGVPTQDALRLVIDVFIEAGDTARLLTATLLVRRGAGAPDTWGIAAVESVSALDGLYRLRLDADRQFDVEGLELTAPDLRLTLTRGSVFTIQSDAGMTGLVFVGDGRMRFSPEPESERLQVRLFAGQAPLDADFERLLVRFHPSEIDRLFDPARLRSVTVDRRTAQRATEFASRELPRSYRVDLDDVSADSWYFLPAQTDVLTEIRTGRHGTLTYSRIHERAEDIALLRRDRQLTIARYTSEEMIPIVGRSYDEESLREYDILDYEVDARIASGYRQLEGRARLRMQALKNLSFLTLRLEDALRVREVTSPGFGPLAYVRLKEQDAIAVRLPREIAAGSPLTLEVAYAGSVSSQQLDSEQVQEPVVLEFWNPDPRLLLSAASYWYPQNIYSDFATATLRVAAPAGSMVVASGEPVAAAAPDAAAAGSATDDPSWAVFRADRPLRYLAVLVSRLTEEEARELVLDDAAATLRLNVVANSQQRRSARRITDAAEDVLRFYAGLVLDVPYPSTTIAIVDATLPGGHSPAHFILLQNPIQTPPGVWQRDPAAFQDFPEFFLAHELAHQWWGQAVGPKNYRERWISEGLAQYFAAMYAEHARGERMLHDMLESFRRWSLSQSGMGPLSLGERLGHVSGGGRVLRALAYNKGAAVLHMLRRLLGHDAFVRGLRRFYYDNRFGAAGTDDLRRAFETESGQSLDRFFDLWIRGAGVPSVEAVSTIGPGSVSVHFEQTGAEIYDLPVTVTIVYRDGRAEDRVVVMTDRQLAHEIPTSGDVRRVEINRDAAALAEFRTRERRLDR